MVIRNGFLGILSGHVFTLLVVPITDWKQLRSTVHGKGEFLRGGGCYVAVHRTKAVVIQFHEPSLG